MKFHIPFTLSGIEKLKRRKIIFKFLVRHKKSSKLQDYLENSEAGITREQYLNVVSTTFFLSFTTVFLLSTPLFVLLGIKLPFLFSLGISLVVSLSAFFSQIVYPMIYLARKERDIERNLIHALQDILIQLNSGIALFSILINISASDYGELSNQFKKIVRKINAGFPQMDVLEEAGDKNTSVFFKRTLWQISNGMRAGSDISIIIRESIKSLTEEQLIQVQRYGNKLNPIIMFYMLISVILPALAITFLTIISSLVNLQTTVTILLYLTIFVVIIFIQIMFLGTIKSARPSLL